MNAHGSTSQSGIVEAVGSSRGRDIEATEPRREEGSGDDDHSLSLPPPMAKVGRYEVLGRLAVGGMAEIFLGRESLQSGTLRHMALKLLRRQAQNEADERYFEELFLREGRTAAQLVHPNICHVYEFGKWRKDFFIAMEWIDGLSLKDVLVELERRGMRMPVGLAVGIAAKVAGALEYAHTARNARRKPLEVVHLDVTPHNIMLRHDGEVKLLDFGVAQVSDPQGDSRSDMIKGKNGYMAPEQVLQKPLDGRVDVFGLGICLYESLTGVRLFRRDTLKDTLEALLKKPIPSLTSRRSDLSPELDAIVQKALARDPAQRYQSAGELQAALESYLAATLEVVSSRHISGLMRQLFPNAQANAPVLDTSAEILARLVSNVGVSDPPPLAAASMPVAAPPLAAEPASAAELRALGPEPSDESRGLPTRSALRPRLLIIGVLAALVACWVVFFGSGPAKVEQAGPARAALTEPVPSPAAAQPTEPSPAPPGSPPAVAQRPSLPQPSEAPSSPPTEPEQNAEVGGSASERNTEQGAPDSSAPDLRRNRPRASKQRVSPGFVDDPGF